MNLEEVYIRTSINNKEGGLLFDTGSKSSYLADSLINHVWTSNTSISQGKQNLFDISEVKKLFSSSTLKGHTNNCMGVIGNNIIEKYTWDFDLENKTVHIGRKLTPKLNSQIPMDTLSIHYVDGKIRSSILVNDSPVTVNIESASDYQLVLKGKIPNKDMSFFNDIDIKYTSLKIPENGIIKDVKIYNILDFAQVRVGDSYFNNVATRYLYDKQSFIGVSIWHHYKRVIVDNSASQIKFIGNISEGKLPPFSASEISRNILNYWYDMLIGECKKIDIFFKYGIKLELSYLNIQQDTIKGEITIFGNYKLIAKGKNQLTYHCKDSVKNFNGKLYGKCDINIKNGVLLNIKEYVEPNLCKLKFDFGKEGHIYIKGLNNVDDNLMLFDTGSSNTVLYSKAYKNTVGTEKIYLGKWNITDANNIVKNLPYFNVNEINIGELALKNYSFLELDQEDKNPNEVGIIGFNIIKDYIWDFDMNTKVVNVFKKPPDINISKSGMKLNLIRTSKSFNVPIIVNNKSENILLDSGCSRPLLLDDKKHNIQYFSKYPTITHIKSAFDEEVPDEELNKYQYGIIKAKVGFKNFPEVVYGFNRNDNNNLFGIPFWHEYDRVVLDGINNKLYFLNERQYIVKPPYSVTKITEAFTTQVSDWNLNKYDKVKINSNHPKEFPISFINNVNDTIKSKHTVYGTYIIKAKDLSKPVVHCKDSVKLPNGEMIYEKYQFNMNDEVWKAK